MQKVNGPEGQGQLSAKGVVHAPGNQRAGLESFLERLPAAERKQFRRFFADTVGAHSLTFVGERQIVDEARALLPSTNANDGAILARTRSAYAKSFVLSIDATAAESRVVVGAWRAAHLDSIVLRSDQAIPSYLHSGVLALGKLRSKPASNSPLVATLMAPSRATLPESWQDRLSRELAKVKSSGKSDREPSVRGITVNIF